MNLLIYIILGLLVILLLLFFYFFQKQKEELEKFKKDFLEDQSLNLMNQNIQGLRGEVNQLQNILSQRLDGAAALFKNLGVEIGRLQDLSTSIKDLQEFLKSPKLRGNLGEQILKDLLRDILPQEAYSLQHRFKEGQIVDAIIKTSKGLIPIDSKFPMEVFKSYFEAKGKEKKTAHQEFRRALKKHIISISQKYISPKDKTLNFAVMYIPSESVYYQIMSRDQDLVEFGYKNKVFIVSPNTFYYFLKLILTGLETHKIDQIAQEIINNFEEIKNDSDKLGQYLLVLSRHIKNAYLAMDATEKQYEKMNNKLAHAKRPLIKK